MDRYFIDRLVDHTFVLEGNGTIKDYPGNYTEYRNWISEQKEKEKEQLKINAAKQNEAPVKVEVIQEVKTAPAKKLSYKTQRELEELELEIPQLEEKKLDLETQLAAGISDYNEIQKLTEEIKVVADSLESKSMRWLEIQEELL